LFVCVLFNGPCIEVYVFGGAFALMENVGIKKFASGVRSSGSCWIQDMPNTSWIINTAFWCSDSLGAEGLL
jgi:hypothetical protein